MNPRPLLFDYWEPYVGNKTYQILIGRSDHMLFHSPHGVGGLAKVEHIAEGEDYLSILAINADHPGAGQLRNFIGAAKESFSSIGVWVIENMDLKNILLSYGFRPWKKLDDDGMEVSGMVWIKA